MRNESNETLYDFSNDVEFNGQNSKKHETEASINSTTISPTPLSFELAYSKTFEADNWTNLNSSFFGDFEASTSRPGQSTSGIQNFPGKNFVIPLYTLIFVLAVIGNVLVISTLIKNRRMRTVTNVLLLNLAIADLLLGVFCMPVTLIGQILRNFVFGHMMCRIIPYFQAVSVSVGVWTLVAISLERYFAICRPLQSRKWQTRSHAYKMIFTVWFFTLICNIPITIVSELQPIRNTGRYKCREIWPNQQSEKVFNLCLDFLLLLIPLCIMGLAYSLIVSKLWKGLRIEMRHNQSDVYTDRSHGPSPEENSIELSTHSQCSMCRLGGLNGSNAAQNSVSGRSARDPISNEIVPLKGGKGLVVRWKKKDEMESSKLHPMLGHNGNCNSSRSQSSYKVGHSRSTRVRRQSTIRGAQRLSRAIRSNYTNKSIDSKKKVIRMLFVLVVEFFICWTPLYVMNTWYMFDSEAVYNLIGPLGVVLVQLLAYASSCCNPITYSFMNRQFRQSFLKVFQCSKSQAKMGPPTYGRGSELSANDSLLYGVQGCTVNKSDQISKAALACFQMLDGEKAGVVRVG